MAGKRKGLGKGLGAYFGDDLMMESTIKKTENDVSRETSKRKKTNEVKTDQKKNTKEQYKNKNINTKIDTNTEDTNREDTNIEEDVKDQKIIKDEPDQSSMKAQGEQIPDSFQIKNKKAMETTGERMMKLSLIVPNSAQPRKKFDEEQLQELSESIKKYGVLQPLLVQEKEQYYEIIAGERRWRAAALAGLQEVPVVVRDYDKQRTMEVALIENLQREDLNPVEEAMAYQQLMEEFHLTQEEIAEKVAKSRTAITNTVRLLKLDPRVLDLLVEGGISSGHARALLALENGDLQMEAARKIMVEGLSVRNVERLVKKLAKPEEEKKKEPVREDSFIYHDLEERMKTIMGTKVSINRKDKNKGRIEIEYYSSEELERLVDLIESIQEEKGGNI